MEDNTQFKNSMSLKTFMHKQGSNLTFYTNSNGWRGFRCGSVEGYVSEKAFSERDPENLQYVEVHKEGKIYPTICIKKADTEVTTFKL